MKSEHRVANIPKITPSSVGDLNCSKRFWALRVLGQWPPREPNAWACGAFGQAVHEVLAEVYNPRHQQRPNLNALEIASRKAFARHRYADAEQEATHRHRCERMVCGYVEQDDPEDAEGTIKVEHPIEKPIHLPNGTSFVVSGRLDRVIVRASQPNTLLIRDYKTTKPRLDLDHAFMSLWLAKLEWPQFDRYELQYDWLDEGGRVERDTVTAARVKGLYAPLVARIEQVLGAHEHPAEPCDGCVFCPLRAECQPQVSIAIDPNINPFEEAD